MFCLVFIVSLKLCNCTSLMASFLSDSSSICNNTKHRARIIIAWCNKTPYLWESITHHNHCDTVTHQHTKPVCGLTKMLPAWGCLNQRCDNFKSHGLLPLHCQTVCNHASFAKSHVPVKISKVCAWTYKHVFLCAASSCFNTSLFQINSFSEREEQVKQSSWQFHSLCFLREWLA